jgi:SUKH-3 immunity protein
MEFNEKAKQKFIDAGWYSGRDVLGKYQNVKYFNQFPAFLVSFLREFGELTVKCDNPIKNSTVSVQLNILPVFAEYNEEEGETDFLENMLGVKVYPFAYYKGDGFLIGADEQGKIYMLGGGDGYYLRGATFKEGIENLLFDDWSGSSEFDLDTNEWKP